MSCRLLVPGSLLRASDTFTAVGRDHHYLTRVRRLKVGDGLVLFGDGVERPGVVERSDEDSSTIRMAAPLDRAPDASVHWIALLPLIKGERMERCLTGLTELGVDEIRLYRASRAVVTLEGPRAAERLARYQRLVDAAAAQSKRAREPYVSGLFDLSEVLTVTESGLGLLFWEERPADSLAAALAGPVPSTVAFLTGPEGGLTADEVLQATQAGFKVAGLGPFILRAETAPVAALSMLQYHYRRPC